MSFKNKFDKGTKFKRTKNYQQIVDDVTDKPASNMQPEKADIVDLGLNVVAMRDLPKSSYTIQADPYRELNQSARPYDMIAKNNKMVDPKYAGEPNLDGGYVSQYLTSTNSRLLKSFDSMIKGIGLNYRFLNLDRSTENTVNHEYRGSQLLRKMYDAVNEAVSQLDATTFTYLNVSRYYWVVTSLEIPDVDPAYTITDPTAGKLYVYDDVAAVILVMSLYYQITIQQTILMFNYVNKLKNNEATLLHMQFERESTPVNELMGQINKATFTTLLDSFILSIKGEYVDAAFIKTINLFAALNSRSNDDMLHPIKELAVVMNQIPVVAAFSTRTGSGSLPDLSNVSDFDQWMKDNGSTYLPVYYHNNFAVTTKSFDMQTDVVSVEINGSVQKRDLKYLTKKVALDFSVTGVLTYARNMNRAYLTDVVQSADGTTVDSLGGKSASKFYNELCNCVQATINTINRFKTASTDLRTVFDKLNPTGLINWSKKVTLLVTKDYDVPTIDVKLVDDVYATLMGGPGAVKFSANTGRWTSYTLWDLYKGIPEYDVVSGGAFLTLCGKELDTQGATNSDIEYLPIAYTVDNTIADGLVAIDRLGTVITIQTQSVVVGNNVALKRLAILPSQDAYTFRSPKIKNQYPSNASISYDDVNKSWINKIMLQTANVSNMLNRAELNDNIVAIYDYEMVDVSKSMISYAKAYGPMKGTYDQVSTVGFQGLTVNTKN